MAKPDHNAIHDLLQDQPLTQADLCRKISSVVDDFLLQFPDVPPGSSEFQTSCAAFITSFNGIILIKLFEALESDFAKTAAAIGTTLRDTFDAGGDFSLAHQPTQLRFARHTLAKLDQLFQH